MTLNDVSQRNDVFLTGVMPGGSSTVGIDLAGNRYLVNIFNMVSQPLVSSLLIQNIICFV